MWCRRCHRRYRSKLAADWLLASFGEPQTSPARQMPAGPSPVGAWSWSWAWAWAWSWAWAWAWSRAIASLLFPVLFPVRVYTSSFQLRLCSKLLLPCAQHWVRRVLLSSWHMWTLKLGLPWVILNEWYRDLLTFSCDWTLSAHHELRIMLPDPSCLELLFTVRAKSPVVYLPCGAESFKVVRFGFFVTTVFWRWQALLALWCRPRH